MGQHVCPWWGGYFIDNWVRRWFHDPLKLLAPCVRSEMTAMDFGCGMGMFSIAMSEGNHDASVPRSAAVDLDFTTRFGRLTTRQQYI